MGIGDEDKTYLEKTQRIVPDLLPELLAENRELGDYFAFSFSIALALIGGLGLYFPNIVKSNLENISYLIIGIGVAYLAFVGSQARVYELISRKRFSLDDFNDEYRGEKKLGMTEDGYVVYHSGSSTDETYVVEMGLFGNPKSVTGQTVRRIDRRLRNNRVDWAELSEFGQIWLEDAEER